MSVQQRDDQDKRPASRRVADELRAKIDAGTYPVGTPLPPYRQLAAEYDVAKNTAIAAVRILRDAGYVTIRPNAGAQVRDRTNQTSPADELPVLRTELDELRNEVRRASANLAAIESRIATVVSRISALEQ